MAISINPIFPVIAAQGVPADFVLQPGTVIDAEVLKVLANNAVRIAIANLSIEVMSEIPLQVGQTLQLAVSQMPEGIRLAVVGQAGNAGASAAPTDTVTLAPDVAIGAAAKPSAVATPANGSLTALEALAVSAAAQTAATKQAGLSQLFVNLDAASASESLPSNVQQAALQLLGQRLPLDAALSGNDIKTAFQKSGLFLEQTLAAGLSFPAGSGAVPDLKAALLAFKQMLSLQLGNATAEAALSSATAGTQKNAATDASAGMGSSFGKVASPPSAPSLMPDLDVQEILLPQARVPVAEDLARVGGRFGRAAGTPLDATASRIALNLLQETLSTPGGTLRSTTMPQGAGAPDAAFARTNTPPPPIRDALPVAQGVGVPSIAVGASSTEVLHRLLGDTDAALARQTLLQVASLPDRADLAVARNDPAVPRWNFEIPFATALGTAVAQFEIARDGGGSEAEAAKRIWRARFSLDIEPAGPVHALVSLTGDTTSVRMWAERPGTASRLRAGAAQLSQALSLAELKPGDIVIREGAPPQTASALAGHFLDRAL